MATTSPSMRHLGWSLGLRADSPAKLAREIERGLDVKAVERLRSHLGLSAGEAAAAMDTSARTLARRRRGGRLGRAESDRLYRLAYLFERAVEVLEDEEAAGRWLRAPQWGLGGRVPIEFAQTEPGAREVEALLDRIEYGVLA